MGLSRNKVAVPEGAAGTPPFWSGELIYNIGVRGHSTVRCFSPLLGDCLYYMRIVEADASSSPNGGLAQLARALAWHARGHRFDPDILHTESKGQV